MPQTQTYFAIRRKSRVPSRKTAIGAPALTAPNKSPLTRFVTPSAQKNARSHNERRPNRTCDQLSGERGGLALLVQPLFASPNSFLTKSAMTAAITAQR